MSRRTTLTVLLSTALVGSLMPATAHSEMTVGVNGAVSGAEFSATLTLRRFVREDGHLLAIGTLHPIPHSGPPASTRVGTLRVPVTSVSGTCEMLRLELGPVDLTQHGPLHVNEFAVHVSAADGGPLGESLCSIARKLDDPEALAKLLSQLLDLVGCLMRGAPDCSKQPAA